MGQRTIKKPSITFDLLRQSSLKVMNPSEIFNSSQHKNLNCRLKNYAKTSRAMYKLLTEYFDENNRIHLTENAVLQHSMIKALNENLKLAYMVRRWAHMMTSRH